MQDASLQSKNDQGFANGLNELFFLCFHFLKFQYVFIFFTFFVVFISFLLYFQLTDFLGWIHYLL